MRFSLVVLLLLICSISGAQLSRIQERQLIVFESARYQLEVDYAMLSYKHYQFGVQLEELAKEYHFMIENGVSFSEYQKLSKKEISNFTNSTELSQVDFEQMMIAFAAEFRDGHFNISRSFAEFWTMGLRTEEIQGRLFVTGFRKKSYAPWMSDILLQVGDEILEVDGRSVTELAAELMPYAQRATFASRRNYAMNNLINRNGRNMPLIEDISKPVEIKFLRGKKTWFASFYWSNYTELEGLFTITGSNVKTPGYHLRPYVFGYKGHRESAFTSTLSRRKKLHDFTKDLAAIPYDEAQVFVIESEGTKIGVLRIPSFSPSSGRLLAVEWLQNAVQLLNKNSDILVLDLLANTGGASWYTKNVLQIFAENKRMIGHQAIMRLNKTRLSEIRGWFVNPNVFDMSSIMGMELGPADRLRVSKAVDSMERRLNDGEKWSVPFAFGGHGLFSKNRFSYIPSVLPYRYKKKIVLLVDKNSMSWGDMFGDILRANGRVLVVGENSGGLGGTLFGGSGLPGLNLKMRHTNFLQISKRLVPIENMGLLPDVVRHYFPADLRDGFESYSNDILSITRQYLNGDKVKDIAAKYSASSSFRIPAKLVKADQILASLHFRDEVLDRLKTMSKLKRFQTSGLSKLIATTQKDILTATDFYTSNTPTPYKSASEFFGIMSAQKVFSSEVPFSIVRP